MLTTKTVLNGIEGSLQILIQLPSCTFILIGGPKTEDKNECAGSESVLRFDSCNHQAKTVPKFKDLPAWFDFSNNSGDWLRDQEDVPSYPLDIIRKMLIVRRYENSSRQSAIDCQRWSGKALR